MIVFDSNGKEIKWNYAKYYNRKLRPNKSSGHQLALSILERLHPNSTIYEEVSLPTDPVTYADFFIPDKRLIVEVQGEQHYKFNPHFHKSKLDFYRAQTRDRKKTEWCNLNQFTIIHLPYNETETWTSLISQNQ